MFSKDIGIDLGTANILINVKKEGIVLNEPSVVAIEDDTKKVLAVGTEAYEMLGRTPLKVKTIRPMKDGVIADFELTLEMLNYFIRKVKAKNIFCKEEEPKVAAVGVGLDISKPNASMIVDIGGGTTDVAVLSLGSIVTSSSIKIAGNTFDNEIIKYVKDKYNLLIGEVTSEEIKKKIGTVYNGSKKDKIEVKGRDLVDGLPKTIYITSEEIQYALKSSAIEIVRTIKTVLENTPPELSADIINKGIVLTGGGAMLDGLDTLLREELKVPIHIAENPLTSVAEGAGIMLENLNLIEDLI